MRYRRNSWTLCRICRKRSTTAIWQPTAILTARQPRLVISSIITTCYINRVSVGWGQAAIRAAAGRVGDPTDAHRDALVRHLHQHHPALDGRPRAGAGADRAMGPDGRGAF